MMDTIEAKLSVLEIRLDGNCGEVVVTYSIRYMDVSGNLVHSKSADRLAPDIWELERQGNDWVITRILWYTEWLALQNEK